MLGSKKKHPVLFDLKPLVNLENVKLFEGEFMHSLMGGPEWISSVKIGGAGDVDGIRVIFRQFGISMWNLPLLSVGVSDFRKSIKGCQLTTDWNFFSNQTAASKITSLYKWHSWISDSWAKGSISDAHSDESYRYQGMLSCGTDTVMNPFGIRLYFP